MAETKKTETKITVDEIVSIFDSNKRISSSHNVLGYMPYSQKIAFVKGIVDATSFVEVEGKKLYKRDTPASTFLFAMRLIKEYTDIEIDDSNVVEEYDKLVSSGAMDALLGIIAPKEIKILEGLLDMVEGDLEDNTRSLVSFLETKFDSADMALNTILGVLDRPDVKARIEDALKANK